MLHLNFSPFQFLILLLNFLLFCVYLILSDRVFRRLNGNVQSVHISLHFNTEYLKTRFLYLNLRSFLSSISVHQKLMLDATLHSRSEFLNNLLFYASYFNCIQHTKILYFLIFVNYCIKLEYESHNEPHCE